MELGEELDVSEHGAPGEQRRVLEHVAEPVPVNRNFTRGRFQQARGDLEERRLSASGRTDDRDELALRHRERGIAHGLGAIGEDHADAPERERLTDRGAHLLAGELAHRGVLERLMRRSGTSQNLVALDCLRGTSIGSERPRITAFTFDQSAQAGRHVLAPRSGCTWVVRLEPSRR